MVLFLTGIALGIAGVGHRAAARAGLGVADLADPDPGLALRRRLLSGRVLPGWMQAVSRVLPPSYVFEGMRAVVAGKPAPWDRLAIGGGLAVVYLVLACLFFAAVYRYAIRTGLIARYSAETVS